MKKIVSLVLLVAMLMCVGNCVVYAESTSTYTPDELAYVAYCDIGSAYYNSIYYLETLGGLWESLLDKNTWDDVDSAWLLEYRADPDEGIQRNMFLIGLGQEKFGYEDSRAFLNSSILIDAIKQEAAERKVTDPRAAIFILLEWGQESGLLPPFETLESKLEDGMEVIRMIMNLNADYTNLNALKDYYKEAYAIYDYMADFSDDYISFTEKLEQYQTNYDSWEIEFDFIFGTDSYETYGDAYSRFIEEREAQAQ